MGKKAGLKNFPSGSMNLFIVNVLMTNERCFLAGPNDKSSANTTARWRTVLLRNNPDQMEKGIHKTRHAHFGKGRKRIFLSC